MLIWARKEIGYTQAQSADAIGISSDGKISRYDKINLATGEREHFTAGNILVVFKQRIEGSEFKIAVQLCRELKFPEQWKYLSLSGAIVIFHLNPGLQVFGLKSLNH